MRKERASFLRGQARRAHTNHQHTRDKDWKKSCNTSTHHTLHTVNSKQTFRISVSYEQQTAHTDVWLAFPLRKKKNTLTKKKKFRHPSMTCRRQFRLNERFGSFCRMQTVINQTLLSTRHSGAQRKQWWSPLNRRQAQSICPASAARPLR